MTSERCTAAELLYGLRRGTVHALLHLPGGGTTRHQFKASAKRVEYQDITAGSRELLSREQAYARFSAYGANWEMAPRAKSSRSRVEA